MIDYNTDANREGQKRLLHLVHTPRHSGAETLVRELCLIHQAQGIETAIASFAPCDTDFMPSISKLREAGVQVFFPDKKLAGLDRAKFFKNAYQNFNPNLIYGHSVLPALYGRLALPFWGSKPKFVSVLHSATNYVDIKLWGSEMLLARRGDFIVSVSETGAIDYRSRIPLHKPIRIIPNGADISQICKACKDRETHRARLNISPNDQVILQVGRLSPIKQQPLTLEALAPTLKLNPKINLWFAGLSEDVSYEQSIKEMIADFGLTEQVLLLGSRDDIPALLSAADLYVMPSLMEAHSVAMIEALASGIPVVASDIQTLQFAASYDGVALVPPQDSDALTDAVIRSLSLPQQYNRDLSLFDITVTAKHYRSLLEVI